MGAAARVAGEGGRQGGSDCEKGFVRLGAASCEGDSDEGLGLQVTSKAPEGCRTVIAEPS